MNTEIILAVLITAVILIAIALIIYAISNTNKRLLLLEENSLIESETSDAFSVRLQELEKLVESQQPQTEQHNPFHAEGSDYSPFFKGDNHTEQPEVKDEPRTFVNVYVDEDGRHISDIDHPSYQEAYDERDNLSTYIETVEIIRQKKP